MDRLDAIRMFVRVVETGAFSAVGRELGVGQPAVSKQIASLEAHLGAQLLTRTTRRLNLTDAGRDFYEAAVRLVDDLEAAESRVGRGFASPSGLVRATVAPVFARLQVTPRLGAFFTAYPDVSVELVVTDRATNLVEEGVDLAIHNGALADSSLVIRKIAETPVVTVASTAYLERRGTPASPTDLERHDCVVYAPGGAPRAWTFDGRFGPIAHAPKGRFRTHDAEQIRAAVLADLGLAHTPGWLFADDLAAGTVRLVLRDYAPPRLPISVVRSRGRFLAGKVRVFADFLAKAFAEEPDLAIG